jgi:two-component system OmpR family sensor kinase
LAAGWSLRAQLIGALVALIAIVCLIIGGSTVFALNRSLNAQLDGKVQEAINRAAGRPAGLQGLTNCPTAASAERSTCSGGAHGGPGPDQQSCETLGFMSGPGNAVGTVGACLQNGQIVAAKTLMLDANAQAAPADLPVAQYATTFTKVPTDRRPHTYNLGNLGTYRLAAAVMSLSGQTVVVGLPTSSVDQTTWDLATVVVVVALAGLIVAAIAGAFIIRNTLRPLRRVASTAARVSDMPLDRGEVALSVRVPDVDTDPRTEVGQVGAAINRMLGHIGNALNARHASETRVRQFVADASHELRTPLAAIRGYAELTRRSGQPVSPDVAHALRRVESESARMTTLVEDLLLLARLDSGRPLEHEPVDLSRLVVDAVSDAHAAGPEHRWELDLPPDEVTVPGDGARLHQVLANLLANARTHTPSGSIVVTSVSRAKPGWAMLTVTDNGPGIPPNLLPDIFERFARGDSSRSRAAGSTGLGLAIVAAVVEAHRGRVEVISRPGQTAFTVWLPNTGGT